MKSLLLLLALIYCASAAINSDLVTNLPGYPSNRNFSIYSGLLDLPNTKTKQIHYVLITKAGQTTTFNNAPLVLWLNGGPGCSSLDGFIMENGPYILEDGQKEFNGTYNIWSWNEFANILYFESPAGVGFSPVTGKTDYNDNITTQDSYNALLDFFNGFPELLANDFWISGESYAGIYVPFLGAYIDDQNKLLTAPVINLQGIMVGNGVGSWSNNLATQIDFYYGHYLIPDDVYTAFYQYCSQDVSSAPCTQVLNQIDELTALVNPYDIYRYCFTDDTISPRGWLFNQWLPGVNYALRNTDNFKVQGVKGSEVPCLYTAGIQQYLNRDDVKKALHVDPNIHFGVCNITINQNYVITPEGSVAKHQQLMQNGYKVLIYSGDTDAAVPYTSTLNWIENLNLGVKDAWRPWYQGDQVSGFVQVYNGLTFVTVKGVGHQVPAWKHQEGYVLIKAFMDGKPLPSKNSKSSKKIVQEIDLCKKFI